MINRCIVRIWHIWTGDCMQVKTLSREEYEVALEALGVDIPVEQLPVWQDFESTVDGRSPWGYVAVLRDGETAALASFVQYETHGYRYLRAHHAPVWVDAPSAQDEAEALEALVAHIRQADRSQVFMRLAVDHELPMTRSCLSTLPYDTTVVVDLSGGEEAIFSRMKPRGRRDVRKALRECPASMADETDLAVASFEEYHKIMCDTAARDGFVPAPCSYYANMMRVLGPDHCRVYAARIDGELVGWSLVTVSGSVATRYYAATVSGAGRMHVADALVHFEMMHVAELGCTSYDLMGIGSEFAPETMNLNEFKTKFAKEGTVRIAPDRDVPIKGGLYAALQGVKKLRAHAKAVRR